MIDRQMLVNMVKRRMKEITHTAASFEWNPNVELFYEQQSFSFSSSWMCPLQEAMCKKAWNKRSKWIKNLREPKYTNQNRT
jgi:hypothetical protein